jgi:hypothetical protein
LDNPLVTVTFVGLLLDTPFVMACQTILIFNIDSTMNRCPYHFLVFHCEELCDLEVFVSIVPSLCSLDKPMSQHTIFKSI